MSYAQSYQLTKEEEEEIQSAFTTMDTNKSQSLDVHEFIFAMRALGFDITKIKAKNYMVHYKAQEEGLSFSDFKKIATKYFSRKIESEEAEKSFAILDYDKSGKISAKDLVCLYHKMGIDKTKEDFEYIFKEFDEDGDGELNLKEFTEIVHPTR